MAKVIVVGGGPSGMMAAIAAAKNNNDVTIIEKNEKLGKKMFISGKGRCNITSSKYIDEFFDYIPGNPNFLYSALYSFTNEDTVNFFNELGVKLKVERGDRIFPESNKSSDLIQAMKRQLVKEKVSIKLNSRVKKFICSDEVISSAVLEDDSTVEGEYFILCTGGASYPQTGSTGDGYKIAQKLGHSITTLNPALVPIEIDESWVKKLQGLSLRNVTLSIVDSKSNILYEEFGEMLFTHFGISGPIVLSASRAVKQNTNLKAVVNLKPALQFEQLDKRLQRDFLKYSNKDFKNSLDDLLPKKLTELIVDLSNIVPDKKCNSITKKERLHLVNLLQNFSMSVKGLRPISEAIVTSGGVNVKEVDPSTMRSMIVSNLYFAGELLDVDAYTGGFNMQIALSTGFLAGIQIK
ncbi:MAG: NAD(P)/FAD-dependent oxidoreductase [Clostridium luticellarii]|jgi:predicted Rossmann fold flavoprotein|uniref:Dihydrolipoamide dehydrogenase n=1 Tax=Clostridium luticellarii TaxID=1691940 RepID=A0A2T0BCB5_9CLOT|nr:NAD(P)/FAD-dependent oxidoreductase [Clostridium luticellarii]MCI1994878.1 NAD(P)/FAD-dependent oxidoreductase [Clostridium luticellarii]MCI2039981.1 NAD(P)/FAD-dependent oxidoreductase [Clostridium luticellarii]PRR81536.1 dihydrolipoamide dehydrogenase [Clostridium luticellarii]